MRQVYVRHKISGVILRTIDGSNWGDSYETLSQAEGKRLYRAQETKALRKRLKPGSVVYVKQNRVSRSGMYRRLDLYVVEREQLERITYSAAIVMDWPIIDTDIGVRGCGMDMHFHTVYTLGRCLFPDGFKGKNRAGGKLEQRDGGYALKHRSL